MQKKVEDLVEGDMVDLESCPHLKGTPVAENLYGVVEKVERETEDCVLVWYEGVDAVGYAPGTELALAEGENGDEGMSYSTTPWTVGDTTLNDGSLPILDGDMCIVALVQPAIFHPGEGESEDRQHDNANLLAAAPELRSILKEALTPFRGHLNDETNPAWVRKAREILSTRKAEESAEVVQGDLVGEGLDPSVHAKILEAYLARLSLSSLEEVLAAHRNAWHASLNLGLGAQLSAQTIAAQATLAAMKRMIPHDRAIIEEIIAKAAASISDGGQECAPESPGMRP